MRMFVQTTLIDPRIIDRASEVPVLMVASVGEAAAAVPANAYHSLDAARFAAVKALADQMDMTITGWRTSPDDPKVYWIDCADAA